jgi:hypothetical protein
MNGLKRTLYLQAALWTLAGIAIGILPKTMLHIMGQPLRLEREVAWIRLLGVESIGLAMFMVLVAHRIEEIWWWCWAFAFVDTAIAIVVLLNTGFGLEDNQSRAFWWGFSAVTVAFAFGMLSTIFVTSRERPLL